MKTYSNTCGKVFAKNLSSIVQICLQKFWATCFGRESADIT